MAEVVVKTCSNPGCDQPGTHSCNACKTKFYCGKTCQTADWTSHKEECDGHLRKFGKTILDKAERFYRGRNWVQLLRCAEIATTKLKQLKDRLLETVQDIDQAMGFKITSLQRMSRYQEAMECAKERYTLWSMNHMRNSGTIFAIFSLIQSFLNNDEYEEAERCARHAMFMIDEMTDNFIPANERTRFLAEGSYWLARAIHDLAKTGGIPPEEMKKAGEEAMVHVRQASELNTQLEVAEDDLKACNMMILGDILYYFNDGNDYKEVITTYELANNMFERLEGDLSRNWAIGKEKLGAVYHKGAMKAKIEGDLDLCMHNIEKALPLYRDASRIYRANNHMEKATITHGIVVSFEEEILQIRITRAENATNV